MRREEIAPGVTVRSKHGGSGRNSARREVVAIDGDFAVVRALGNRGRAPRYDALAIAALVEHWEVER